MQRHPPIPWRVSKDCARRAARSDAVQPHRTTLTIATSAPRRWQCCSERLLFWSSVLRRRPRSLTLPTGATTEAGVIRRRSTATCTTSRRLFMAAPMTAPRVIGLHRYGGRRRPTDTDGRHRIGIGIRLTAIAATVTSPSIATIGIAMERTVEVIATIFATTTITHGTVIERIRGGLAAARFRSLRVNSRARRSS